MTELVIFDLDGVLIDSKHMHFETLNRALAAVDPGLQISMDEHLSIYDGLSTSRKLELLAANKGLKRELFDQIWQDKQAAALDYLSRLEPDPKLIALFDTLSAHGIKIAVASNTVRKSLQLALAKLGVMRYVDYAVSNQDVSRIKPYPEMFWRCMIAVGALPKTTVIFEDSHIGRQAAIDSGAILIPILDPSDLTVDKINEAMGLLDGRNLQTSWKNKKMNVLIPMAGAGSRFAQAGYTFPKPLIEVNNKPMIQVVVENLNIDAHYIFLVQEDHYVRYNLKQVLNLIAPGCDIIRVDGVTSGAAQTTLLAKALIDGDDPLLIANSDQFVEWDSNEVMYDFSNDSVDGGILTFKSMHPKWSFARLDDDGLVCEVAEKNPISDNATVGIYYWRQGKDYVKYAEQMIAKDIRVNNEFYVCPVFNEAIADGKRIKIRQVKEMWGLGTPEDLEHFLKHYKR